MRLTHIRLLVPEASFQDCVRFYTDVLGLPTRLGAEPPYTEIDGGDASIGIFVAPFMSAVSGAPAGPGNSDAALLCFEVDDVDATYARLVEKGAKGVAEPQDQPDWMIRIALIRDPAGNLIEINRGI